MELVRCRSEHDFDFMKAWSQEAERQEIIRVSRLVKICFFPEV